jgi:N-acetylglucosamine transport system permease protein
MSKSERTVSKGASRRNAERTRFIITFLAPAVSLYAVFVILPLIQAFGFSLYRWKGLSAKKTWIGFENFTGALSDDLFRKAVTNTFYLLLLVGAVVFLVAPAIASATSGKSKSARLIRGVYLFPHVISMVVVGVLWMFLLNPNWGLINAVIRALHLPTDNVSWLGSPKTALIAVGAAFIWYALGFYIMLFSAALENIPEEVKEAAELDGASGLKRFMRVYWPMIWSIKRVAATYIVINVINVFSLVRIMTDGGPDGATEVPLTHIYNRAIQGSAFGYGSALSIIVFAMTLLLSFGVMALFRHDPMEPRNSVKRGRAVQS